MRSDLAVPAPGQRTTAPAEGPAGREAAVYRPHGLRLRSAVPLRGSSSPGDAFDLDLRWAPARPVPVVPPPGRVVLDRADDERRRYVAVETAGGSPWEFPGVCDFVVERDLAVVERRPDPAADPRLVAVLVSGLVVAFLVSLAGNCVLRASAVAVGGAAIAIAGPSGAGKSTLAAILCAGSGSGHRRLPAPRGWGDRRLRGGSAPVAGPAPGGLGRRSVRPWGGHPARARATPDAGLTHAALVQRRRGLRRSDADVPGVLVLAG